MSADIRADTSAPGDAPAGSTAREASVAGSVARGGASVAGSAARTRRSDAGSAAAAGARASADGTRSTVGGSVAGSTARSRAARSSAAASSTGAAGGAGGGVGSAGAGAGAGASTAESHAGSSEPAPEPGVTAPRTTVLRVGDNVDNFTCSTQLGRVNFYEHIRGKYCLLFSHPADFTPVCTTELVTLVKLKEEFDRRNAVILGLSVDSSKTHAEWVKSIEDQETKVNFPIIGDTDGNIARMFNMVHPAADGSENGRLTIRSVVLIDPEKRIQLLMHYPPSMGRNFLEILRCIDSLTVTAQHKVATPANWAKGEDVVILPTVDEEQAKELFPKGFVSIKPFLRITPDPTL